MSRLLSAVRRAAHRRQAAEMAYRRAIVEAREEHTLEAIGQAAGLTKNGVRYLLYPDPRKEQAPDA